MLVTGQLHVPAALFQGKNHSTYWKYVWVGPTGDVGNLVERKPSCPFRDSDLELSSPNNSRPVLLYTHSMAGMYYRTVRYNSWQRTKKYGIFFVYLFNLRRNINEWNTLPRKNNMSANLEGVCWELAVVGWPESNSRQRQSDCIQSDCGPPTFLSSVSCPPPPPTFVKVIRIWSSPVTCPQYFIKFAETS